MLGNVKVLENEDAQATVIATLGIAIISILFRFYCETIQYFFWLPIFWIYGIPTYYYKEAITNNYDNMFLLVVFFCLSYLIYRMFTYIGRKYKKNTKAYKERLMVFCITCLIVLFVGGLLYYLPEFIGRNELFWEFRQLIKYMSDSMIGTTFEEMILVIM